MIKYVGATKQLCEMWFFFRVKSVRPTTSISCLQCVLSYHHVHVLGVTSRFGSRRKSEEFPAATSIDYHDYRKLGDTRILTPLVIADLLHSLTNT